MKPEQVASHSCSTQPSGAHLDWVCWEATQEMSLVRVVHHSHHGKGIPGKLKQLVDVVLGGELLAKGHLAADSLVSWSWGKNEAALHPIRSLSPSRPVLSTLTSSTHTHTPENLLKVFYLTLHLKGLSGDARIQPETFCISFPDMKNVCYWIRALIHLFQNQLLGSWGVCTWVLFRHFPPANPFSWRYYWARWTRMVWFINSLWGQDINQWYNNIFSMSSRFNSWHVGLKILRWKVLWNTTEITACLNRRGREEPVVWFCGRQFLTFTRNPWISVVGKESSFPSNLEHFHQSRLGRQTKRSNSVEGSVVCPSLHECRGGGGHFCLDKCGRCLFYRCDDEGPLPNGYSCC